VEECFELLLALVWHVVEAFSPRSDQHDTRTVNNLSA
jgi:hypothetical protein